MNDKTLKVLTDFGVVDGNMVNLNEFYFVSGRKYFDDEDTTLFVKACSNDEAREALINHIREENGITSENEDEEENTILVNFCSSVAQSLSGHLKEASHDQCRSSQPDVHQP